MKLPRSAGNLRRMHQARLRRLRRIDTVLAGSLVRQPGHNSLYLTDKVRGKTRTLYIPLSRLEEVKRWNRQAKEARELLAELSEIQRALLHAEIRARRPSRKPTC
jgi:hypothetical protein